MRDLDINQVPSEVDGEERAMMNASTEDDDEESSSINGGSDGPPRKKLRLTREQSRLLEESFRRNHALNNVRRLSRDTCLLLIGFTTLNLLNGLFISFFFLA